MEGTTNTTAAMEDRSTYLHGYTHTVNKTLQKSFELWHLLNARLTVFDRKLPGLNYNRERKPLIDLVVTQSDM